MTDQHRDDSRNFVASLTAAIEQNPLPAALVGMGVLWLFSSRPTLSGSSVQSALGAASEIGSQVKVKAQNLGRSATDVVTGQGGSPARRMREAAANITDLFERQPLILGAVGLTLGAGVAATLRMTNVEPGS